MCKDIEKKNQPYSR